MLGFLRVHLVGMPVHNDIDAVLDGGFYHGLDTLLGKLRIFQIVVFNLNAHGYAYHRGIPFRGQCLHGSLVVEAWPDVVPAKGYTAQDDGLSILVTKLSADHLQLTVFLYRCLGCGIQREG